MKAMLTTAVIFVLLLILAGCSEGLNGQGRIAPEEIHQKLPDAGTRPDAPEPLIYIKE